MTVSPTLKCLMNFHKGNPEIRFDYPSALIRPIPSNTLASDIFEPHWPNDVISIGDSVEVQHRVDRADWKKFMWIPAKVVAVEPKKNPSSGYGEDEVYL
mmetsp:Transcript_1713/g.4609  ORF Transcript_1713/g.4609 Transcript_1713/m.4609 type:complete len:99 (-) Transcript_1713:229-525(-)